MCSFVGSCMFCCLFRYCLLYIYIYIYIWTCDGPPNNADPELEDHIGGDLGYLNSLCNRLFCFGQESTPDIRNNIYLW